MSGCISRDAVELVLPLVASPWNNRRLCSPSVMQKGDTTEKMETHWPHSVQAMQDNGDEAHDINHLMPFSTTLLPPCWLT